jgi:DNA polymerase III sliding clamp (beta) subunit (PCNA family)
MLIQSKTFVSKLKFVQPGKTKANEIYRYVLIEVNEDHQLLMRSFNQMVHRRTILGEVTDEDVFGEGKLLFDAKDFIDALSKIDYQVDLFVNFSDNTISINSQKISLRITGEPAKNKFIKWPELDEFMTEIEIPEYIGLGFQRVAFIPDEGDIQQNFSGVYVDWNSDRFLAVSTDGITLSICKDFDNLLPVDESKSALIPIKAIEYAAQMLKSYQGEFEMYIDSEQFALSNGDESIISIVLSHTFVNYEVIPANFGERIEMTLDRVQFLEAVEVAGRISSKEFNQINIVCDNNGLSIRGGQMTTAGYLSDEAARFASYDLTLSSENEIKFDIYLNYLKLVDMLKSIDVDKIVLQVQNREEPRMACIKPICERVDTEMYLSLVSKNTGSA